jgi:predicted metalloprotease with PDZ domain
MSAVRYEIAAPDAAAHLFSVQLHLPAPAAEGQRLRMPAWIPGSYMIRDYARHIVSLSASDSTGAPVAADKADKSTWVLGRCDGAITVRYEVYAWDLSVRGAHLDRQHAYFNGVCLLLEPLGCDGPFELAIAPIPALPETAWVATAMRAVETDDRGFGTYAAPDYDELIDHPVEIADQARVDFEVNGIPHTLAVRGATDLDGKRLGADLAQICATHHRLLGAPDGFDRYWFLAYALDNGYGGLEHRWSSSLACSRGDLPRAGRKPPETYERFLGLVSHEYFHLWNVKRLKPAAFVPMDLTTERHTGLMWVFEGITSYYDDLALVRSGVIKPEAYLRLLAKTITRVLRVPGRFVQSLEQSSFDAWTKLYKQDENAPNSIISYYTKGALVALTLDLRLRSESAITLDDVMRECWRQFAEGDAPGMPERALERIAAGLSGLALDDFFARMIRGTEDPPLAAMLERFGVKVRLRAARDANDAGGGAVAASKLPLSWLGAAFAGDSATRLQNVLRGGPAERAGLSAGDELVAVDGLRCDKSILAARLATESPGAVLKLHVFRRDELMSFDVTPESPPRDTAVLGFDDDAGTDALALREAWLSG